MAELKVTTASETIETDVVVKYPIDILLCFPYDEEGQVQPTARVQFTRNVHGLVDLRDVLTGPQLVALRDALKPAVLAASAVAVRP